MENRVFCKVVKTNVAIEEYGEKEVYGFLVENKKGQKLLEIKDVSVSRDFAEELAEMINQYEVSEEHIFDVVQDAIC